MTNGSIFSDWLLFSGLFAQPARRPEQVRDISLFSFFFFIAQPKPKERSELLRHIPFIFWSLIINEHLMFGLLPAAFRAFLKRSGASPSSWEEKKWST